MARTTVRSLLEWHHFYVCGDAASGEEAIAKVKQLRPEIVILDVNMPGMNGIQVAYVIRQIAPWTKIVFLTIHDVPELATSLRLLNHTFVPKSAAGTELIPTLNRLIGRTEVNVAAPPNL
jgi:DNA-binding NarL/FixJ family response regulator